MTNWRFWQRKPEPSPPWKTWEDEGWWRCSNCGTVNVEGKRCRECRLMCRTSFGGERERFEPKTVKGRVERLERKVQKLERLTHNELDKGARK